MEFLEAGNLGLHMPHCDRRHAVAQENVHAKTADVGFLEREVHFVLEFVAAARVGRDDVLHHLVQVLRGELILAERLEVVMDTESGDLIDLEMQVRGTCFDGAYEKFSQ